MLPAARAPAAPSSGTPAAFVEPAAGLADRPSAAPPEPPRILRRQAPLSPAPVDIVPRNPSPPPVALAPEVDPDGPTQIRRPARFEERMYSDVTQPLPRSETPAAVEGLASQAPSPGRPAPPVNPPPRQPVIAPPRPPVSAPPRQPMARPVVAPPPPMAAVAVPPPPLPVAVASPPPLPADADTSSTATMPQPHLTPPPAVLVLAGGWRLAAARAVDLVLTGATAAALLFAALSVLGVRAAVQPLVDQAHADPLVMFAVMVGAPFFAVALYQAATVLLLGGTLGGRLVGLRVVRQHDGARPGALRALVRGVAAAVGVLAFGSGPLWGLLIDRRRRGLGDIVARSVMVRTGGGGAA